MFSLSLTVDDRALLHVEVTLLSFLVQNNAFAPQEFLETVTVVLEVVEGGAGSRRVSSTSGGRDKSLQLLRFVTFDASENGERESTTVAPRTLGSRRASHDSVSSIEFPQKASPTVKDDDDGTATAFHAAEYARCRTRLVGWLFRPLLSDAFALASLTQALALLGLGSGDGQATVLVQDMAAWFLALPVGRAADTTVGREAQNCPVLRWLKGVILAWASPSLKRSTAKSEWDRGEVGSADDDGGNKKSFLGGKAAAVAPVRKDRRMNDLFGDPVDGGASGSGTAAGKGGMFDDDDGDDGEPSSDEGSDKEDRQEQQEEGEGGEEGKEEGGGEEGEEEEVIDGGEDDRGNLKAGAAEILRPMYEACAASSRLENASMLSVVTAEALAACREKLQESSLGQVAIGGGEAWVTLARRLRVCLFVDHRLHLGATTEQR